MRVLTVASVSYLPQADVLFASLREHHPELRPTILVPDVTRIRLDEIREQGVDRIADLLCLDDLAFDFLEKARTYYSALEFCSALKVLGSAHILQSESDCLFLDSDMLVLDRLDALLDFPGDILVTPHVQSPLPNDGASPDDLEMCASGFINGGVLCSRAGAAALPWLVSKTKSQWFVAPQLGMYADQLWLSALPFLFEQTCVAKDRGINVAYWNLHERPLRQDGEKIRLLSGEPLSLFHFSGFSRPGNGRLTKHTDRSYDSQTAEVLTGLIKNYEAMLDGASARWGHLRGDIPYNSDPLPIRLGRAADCWADNRLRVVRHGLKTRLQALFAK